ncbi:MAG: glycoside hydrolase family 2 TIM barrel-domain containing protein, partial [Verrucomicrobiota bacterium]
ASSQAVPVELMLSVYGHNFKAEPIQGLKLHDPTCRGNISEDTNTMQAGPGKNFYRFRIELPNARVWQPESPWLYEVQVQVLDGVTNVVLDTRSQTFGMRWFSMDENPDEHGLRGMFRLNGKPIRLRGANTMGAQQRCVMEGDHELLQQDLLLAKAAHMNFLRLTQYPVQTEIYEACDRLGILTQTDLPLFAHLRRNQFAEAVRQTQEMEHLVRSHPCNILVSYINEPFPVEWRTLEHRRLQRADLLRFFRAADEVVRLENPDRVIKAVDGDYSPPAPGLPDNHCYTYWYLGHAIDAGKLHAGYWCPIKPGWYYGCGEFGAEGLDRLELMQQYCPADWLPDGENDTKWSPKQISRAQSWKMGELFFDPPRNAAEWIKATRDHQTWATRQMTEAFRRDPRNVSCAIHLFIDAWPTGWMKTIVDVERVPKPAYYAYRDALTPLMVNLRMDRLKYQAGEDLFVEVWLCNDTPTAYPDLEIRWQLEHEGQVLHAEKFQTEARVCVPETPGVIRMQLPDVEQRQSMTLRAGLYQNDNCVQQTENAIEVFPKSAIQFQVAVIGDQPCTYLEAAGGQITSDADFIWCPDWDSFQTRSEEIITRVEKGAVLMLTQLLVGKHKIADSQIEIRPASMEPLYFLSRATSHPFVWGCASDDFHWWFSEVEQRPAPLCENIISTDDFRPVLRTTDHGWVESEEPEVYAMVEKPFGQGHLVISTIPFDQFTGHNPTAQSIIQRIPETASHCFCPAVTQAGTE